MKNLILILVLLFSGSLIAQQSEVVYESIVITPLKSSENYLIEGVKKHNQKFHSDGEVSASLYSVLIGKDSGKYVWLNGPMTMADYDIMPDSAHMEDWQKNIRNYITNEIVNVAKLNRDASYSPPSWGTSKYILWRTFKIKQDIDSYQKVLETVTKMGEVLNAINAPNPRRVYENVFRSEEREDIVLVYPFKTFTRFSNSNGLPEEFQAEYDRINGTGAFRVDVVDVLSKHTNGWHDTVLMLIE